MKHVDASGFADTGAPTRDVIRPLPAHSSINDYTVWPMEAIDSEIELLLIAKRSKQDPKTFEEDVNAAIAEVLERN